MVKVGLFRRKTESRYSVHGPYTSLMEAENAAMRMDNDNVHTTIVSMPE